MTTVAQMMKSTPENNKGEHPLDTLSALLGDDLARVNEMILGNMQSEVPLIPQLAAYLIAAGGKRIRPLLTLACTRLYGDSSDRPFGLAASVEFIHTATLLHDDVVDESVERRGKSSANVVFGNQASVLVGDFLFSRAFQLMVADGSLDILRILSTASAVIAEGEVLQLSSANDIETSMDRYLQIIGAKTAALFAAACEIGPVIAGANADAQRDMREFGYNLGLAFQIADDVLDYAGEQAKLGKTVGDDFREGKLTAPVLIALAEANAEERSFWTRTMAERNQTDDDLATAQAILKKHNAYARGIDMAHGYAAQAEACLAKAKGGPLRSALLDVLNFSVERSA
jgi:octaprenyl-diphosphate synthase